MLVTNVLVMIAVAKNNVWLLVRAETMGGGNCDKAELLQYLVNSSFPGWYSIALSSLSSLSVPRFCRRTGGGP